MLKQYLSSFRWHKDLWFPFLIDLITGLLLFGLWWGLGRLLNIVSYNLSGGRSVEELKLALLSSPELSQNFVTDLKLFLALIIGGSLLALILTIIILALSRSLIWSNKFKPLWKWVKMTTILIIILLPYFSLLAVIKMVINFLLVNSSPNLTAVINNLLVWAWLIVGLIFLFVNFHSFARIQQVGGSLTYSAARIKNKFREYACCFFYSLITIAILALIALLINKKFYWWVLGLGKLTASLISLVILLAYLAWIRFYVSRT